MRHNPIPFLACTLLLAPVLNVQAGDDAARALVDKAIAAQGGEAKLAKLTAVVARLKGTFHGLGKAMPFTGEYASHGPERHRIVFEINGGGQKLRFIHVLNGDKGWEKANDDTKELDKAALAEARAEAYADWVSTLLPLKDKEFTLTSTGEVNVDKKPARGVKVAHKGQRDVLLYFDKMTDLLAKIEIRVKDDKGQEVTQETLFSDYQQVQGTKQALKITIQRGGKLYLECEITECQLSEKLDAGVFAKP